MEISKAISETVAFIRIQNQLSIIIDRYEAITVLYVPT